MRKIRPAAILEVHRRERDLAHDVDPAHRFVELDAVEDRELAVDERDVAEMQVAVAFADEAVCLAPRGTRRARREFRFGPGAEFERVDARSAASSDSGRICAKFCSA